MSTSDGGASVSEDSDSFYSFDQSDWEYFTKNTTLSVSWKTSLSSDSDSANQMPSEELFNLDSSQLRLEDYLTSDPQTEAMLKYAFTEIWLDSQQKFSEPERSPQREFSVALDAYFNQELANKQDNRIAMNPAETIVAAVESVKSSEEKNMPVQAATPKESTLLAGAKKPIVPAGFDLTRLVET